MFILLREKMFSLLNLSPANPSIFPYPVTDTCVRIWRLVCFVESGIVNLVTLFFFFLSLVTLVFLLSQLKQLLPVLPDGLSSTSADTCRFLQESAIIHLPSNLDFWVNFSFEIVSTR